MTGPATDPLHVLYVGGMPRSGSTLTDLMLHQLPDHVGVGELFYLWRNNVAHDGLCGCGRQFSACPFWQRVGEVAYGGWSEIDPDRVARLQHQVDRSVHIPMLVSRRRPQRFDAALQEYTALLRALYRAVAEVSGCSIVVDSSKRPSLAYVLRTMPDVELQVAHVVRDPRGVAYSFGKHVQLPEGAALRGEMPRSSTRKVARRWVSVNVLIGALKSLGVPLVRIRYEDLVADPVRELGRVLAVRGLTPDESAFDFVTPAGVTLPETHVVAGGRIRLARGAMPLRLDEAWRQEMPARSRRLVTLVTAPLRRRYGYR